MPIPNNDLVDFVYFAVRHLESGLPQLSPEQLIQRWRNDTEYDATIQDIREGLAEHAAGQGVPVAEAFANIRRRLKVLP